MPRLSIILKNQRFALKLVPVALGILNFLANSITPGALGARAIAKNHVFEYIEIYYNRKRLHSMIGYKSPELFEVKKVV